MSFGKPGMANKISDMVAPRLSVRKWNLSRDFSLTKYFTNGIPITLAARKAAIDPMDNPIVE
jgi:hypothetical protein